MTMLLASLGGLAASLFADEYACVLFLVAFVVAMRPAESAVRRGGRRSSSYVVIVP